MARRHISSEQKLAWGKAIDDGQFPNLRAALAEFGISGSQYHAYRKLYRASIGEAPAPAADPATERRRRLDAERHRGRRAAARAARGEANGKAGLAVIAAEPAARPIDVTRYTARIAELQGELDRAMDECHTLQKLLMVAAAPYEQKEICAAVVAVSARAARGRSDPPGTYGAARSRFALDLGKGQRQRAFDDDALQLAQAQDQTAERGFAASGGGDARAQDHPEMRQTMNNDKPMHYPMAPALAEFVAAGRLDRTRQLKADCEAFAALGADGNDGLSMLAEWAAIYAGAARAMLIERIARAPGGQAIPRGERAGVAMALFLAEVAAHAARPL